MVSTGAGQAHPRGCKIRNGHTAFKDGFWCQGWIVDLFKRADRVWESISVYKGLALKTQGPEFDPQYPCNNQETVVVIPTLQRFLQCLLVSPNWQFPVLRVPVSKAKVDGSWGTTLKIVFWFTHRCTHIQGHRHPKLVVWNPSTFK